MKLRISGPIAFAISACGLFLAIAAWRAWELNDDVHGILMASLGKLFSILPKPDDADISTFRADSILSPTETRLIFVARFFAVLLGMLGILFALWTRARGIFSPYYAAAALVGFGACMSVHKLIGLVVAAATLIAVAVIDGVRKRRYNLSLKRDGESRAAL